MRPIWRIGRAGPVLVLVGLSWLLARVLASPPTRPPVVTCAPAALVGGRLVCGEAELAAARSLCRDTLADADPDALRGGQTLALGAGCGVGRISGVDQLALGGTLELNSASALELEALPGIGPTLARRIVEARPFADVDQLVRVPGIGAVRLAGLRGHVRAEFPARPRHDP